MGCVRLPGTLAYRGTVPRLGWRGAEGSRWVGGPRGDGRAAVPSAACTLLGLASHVADEDPVVPTLYVFSVVRRLGFQNAQTMTSVTYSRT